MAQHRLTQCPLVYASSLPFGTTVLLSVQCLGAMHVAGPLLKYKFLTLKYIDGVLFPSVCHCQMPHACRGVFGEAQNALRARSAQRVQLWKGLHPSALSEAVSHFTKVHL